MDWMTMLMSESNGTHGAWSWGGGACCSTSLQFLLLADKVHGQPHLDPPASIPLLKHPPSLQLGCAGSYPAAALSLAGGVAAVEGRHHAAPPRFAHGRPAHLPVRWVEAGE